MIRSWLVLLLALLCGPLRAEESVAAELRTCATFLLSKGETLLVGHNLDESIEVPGLLIVNPRGIAKQSLGYADMGFPGRKGPRISWTSRHGSVVYSTSGREFIDGGMNEAGLYVGEMTLLGSEYPEGPSLTRIYHHAWMQYLLDNFSTVQEVIDSLANVVPDGHCQWHFMVADREGRAAVIEFDEKKTHVYSGGTLPWPVSTNYTYPSCLKKLATFASFGGTRPIDWSACKEDQRFMWATAMLKEVREGAKTAEPAQAFAILKQMACSGNRWSLVFDLKRMQVQWHSYRSRKVKSADFASFDFSPGKPILAVDIHHDIEGDVSKSFTRLSAEQNRAAVERFWKGVDAGAFGNLFWKGRLVNAMRAYVETLRPPP